MKKSHLVLLLATAVLALSSAYSLAAINQVYNIGFEWYSQLNGRYEGITRDVSADRQALPAKDIDLKLSVIDGAQTLADLAQEAGGMPEAADEDGLSDYIYVYCALGRTDSPEFRIKAVDIAQRGNNLEIRLSINAPETAAALSDSGEGRYRPMDIIRMKKSAFPSKGRILAVFKNQDGIQLGERYFYVR